MLLPGYWMTRFYLNDLYTRCFRMVLDRSRLAMLLVWSSVAFNQISNIGSPEVALGGVVLSFLVMVRANRAHFFILFVTDGHLIYAIDLEAPIERAWPVVSPDNNSAKCVIY